MLEFPSARASIGLRLLADGKTGSQLVEYAVFDVITLPDQIHLKLSTQLNSVDSEMFRTAMHDWQVFN
jgi:hypothetical protein